jgi:hypothetical protein
VVGQKGITVKTKWYHYIEVYVVNGFTTFLKQLLDFSVGAHVELSEGVNVGFKVCLAGFEVALDFEFSALDGELGINGWLRTPLLGTLFGAGWTWEGTERRVMELRDASDEDYAV